MKQIRFHTQLTYHLVQQLAVTLSKKHTKIQNFGNVKQKVLVDDLPKHSWGKEVFLQGGGGS